MKRLIRDGISDFFVPHVLRSTAAGLEQPEVRSVKTLLPLMKALTTDTKMTRGERRVLVVRLVPDEPVQAFSSFLGELEDVCLLSPTLVLPEPGLGGDQIPVTRPSSQGIAAYMQG